jgi:hypothetical protein
MVWELGICLSCFVICIWRAYGSRSGLDCILVWVYCIDFCFVSFSKPILNLMAQIVLRGDTNK